MDVIVIGGAVIDNIIFGKNIKTIKHKNGKYIVLPHGSKVEIDALRLEVGGSGHNVATNLAKMGNKVSLLTKIGNDRYGKMVKKSLKKRKVSTRLLKVIDKLSTGFSFVFLTPDKEKTILTYKGANLRLERADLKEKTLKKTRYLLFTNVLGNTFKVLQGAVNLAERNRVKVLANPGITMIRRNQRDVLKILRKCEVSIMNREEAFHLLGTKDERTALKKFRQLGVKYPVITLGKGGAIGYDGKRFYRKKAFKVKLRDTTGAGDGFTAGFLHWFLKKDSFGQAIVFGNATAAVNVRSVGASEDLPTEREILRLIRNRW